MKALALNLVIAVIWLLLRGGRSTVDFFIGFGLGFAMLAAFNAVLPGAADYPRRCLAFVRFGLIFAREFVIANLSVARIVLFQNKESLHPNFIRYDVTGMRPGEILLLSYCITLTPGTTAVHVSDDFQTLVIHALHADAPDAIRRQIDERLKTPMLRFTR
ncbi:MAG: Na+/H+ antiporter subunit E [Verrucomicrobia bacterium]|nr:Na+/H+ antiporter subunit E [Verrucomicrobiota bacterium]